jgi:hypothetical protein
MIGNISQHSNMWRDSIYTILASKTVYTDTNTYFCTSQFYPSFSTHCVLITHHG